METATSHDSRSRPPSIAGDGDAVLHHENTQHLDLASDGDVILTVGAEHVRLRVHSQPLRCASKVFEAMFRADWNAGQELSKEMPREFLIPKDDAEAMRIICCVIHHRNDLVPRYLTPKSILQIAIGVDKYDLTNAFQYAGSAFFIEHSDLYWHDLNNVGFLLAAAFLFNFSDNFGAYTKTLVLERGESYMQIMKDELVRKFLPFETCCMLEELRSKLRNDLYEILVEGSKKTTRKRGWGKARKEEPRKLQVEYSLRHLYTFPISDLIDKLDRTPTEDMVTQRYIECPKGGGRNDVAHREKYSNYMSGELKDIKRKAWITIDCVLRARNGPQLWDNPDEESLGW